MPQIGRELDHLPRRVLARAIPVDERANREGVAQIMNAGTMPMSPELFRRTQPYGLADGGEVVSGATVGDAFAMIRHEERFRRTAEKPVTFPGIGNQPSRGAVG